jgi:perosamine synthetase
VADYVGAAHGVAVSSATAALHLSLRVLGIGPGDEVIVPSLTFIATANAVRYCGATPVFADVDPATFNLDPEAVADCGTPRTRAILLVHQFGLPADLARLTRVADTRGWAMIEDAACALGAAHRGRRIGSHSDLVCFSFHPRKVITTGEGGMIVTSDDRLARQLRRLRHHGMDKTDWDRHTGVASGREAYVDVGYNYRLSDIAAAVGVAQMGRLDQIVAARQRVSECYDAAFAQHPYLQPATVPEEVEPNRQSYALCLRPGCPVDRQMILIGLRGRGINARDGLACIHREPCYADAYGHVSLPVSESLADRMILLPLFAQMSDADAWRVVDAAFDLFGMPAPQATSPIAASARTPS